MKTMKTLKRLAPMLFAWFLLSALFWIWVFTFLTDTVPEKKIVLFADLETVDDRALAGRLERALEPGMKMVQVHPFSYAMLDGEQLTRADLYILRETDMETYLEWLSPLPEGFGENVWAKDGMPLGEKIYDAEAGRGAAMAYLTYARPDGEAEDCYVCFGKNAPEGNRAAALSVARELMGLGETEP